MDVFQILRNCALDFVKYAALWQKACLIYSLHFLWFNIILGLCSIVLQLHAYFLCSLKEEAL